MTQAARQARHFEPECAEAKCGLRSFFRPEVLRRILRFAIVGLTSTVIYAALARWGAGHVEAPLALTSLCAYLLAAPVSFLGHRLWTFGSAGALLPEISRFIALNLLGYGMSAVVPFLLHDLGGLGATPAILATCVIVPCLNFLAMERLVFSGGRQ